MTSRRPTSSPKSHRTSSAARRASRRGAAHSRTGAGGFGAPASHGFGHGNGGQIGNVAGLGSRGVRSGRVRTRSGSPRGSRQSLPPQRGGNLPFADGIPFSRRTLLIGALGVGAVAAIGGGTAAFLSQQDTSGDVTVLDVPESAVTSTNDLGDADDTANHMTLSGSYDLEYGTLIWATDGQVAACLVPGETANPLCQLSILYLSSGNLVNVLKSPVGQTEGYQVYDARAVAGGVVWVEADILEGNWRVYTAQLSSQATLGEPVLADEGGGDWETPTIAATNSRAYWQAMPKLNTDASKENSLVKSVAYGFTDVTTVWESSGRLATPPYSTGDKVVITPRAETSGVYYQLTCLNATSGETLDTLVLPRAMSPLEAGYGDTGFMFSFDAIYNYGGGIANLGTYVPAQDASQGNYSDAPWFRFGRTPTAAPAWCGKYLIVKSTMSVCGVDLSTGTWFSLGSESGSDDYGDYLASTGSPGAIVTYANIDHTTVSGETERCCRVRIWRPVG